ncbi:hypothetical protein FOZ62_000175 [Perkinsus olseni]|uniref:Uncharacterized protein n=1 Tax=Perkinsus olseni TaxID=32597 RepID=A0A7J6SMG6_PEROL|nr:hypothetical protein FOZ62_000175 [Perkinsus olseni]
MLGVKSVKYIGFEVSVSSTAGPSVVVHDDIWAGIRDLLAEFDDNRRVEAPKLAKALGKLIFATQLTRQLKGYLQPLYALLNTFERKKKAGRPLGTIKLSEGSKSLKAIRFLLQVVRRPRVPTWPKPAIEPRKLLFGASDASVDFLAGWISDGLHGRWFRLSTDDPVVRSWVRRYGNSSDQSPSHRDIALYELLAAVCSLRLAGSWESTSDTQGWVVGNPVVLHCDNSAVVGALEKLYSPAPGLAAILRAVPSGSASSGVASAPRTSRRRKTGSRIVCLGDWGSTSMSCGHSA